MAITSTASNSENVTIRNHSNTNTNTRTKSTRSNSNSNSSSSSSSNRMTTPTSVPSLSITTDDYSVASSNTASSRRRSIFPSHAYNQHHNHDYSNGSQSVSGSTRGSPSRPIRRSRNSMSMSSVASDVSLVSLNQHRASLASVGAGVRTNGNRSGDRDRDRVSPIAAAIPREVVHMHVHPTPIRGSSTTASMAMAMARRNQLELNLPELSPPPFDAEESNDGNVNGIEPQKQQSNIHTGTNTKTNANINIRTSIPTPRNIHTNINADGETNQTNQKNQSPKTKTGNQKQKLSLEKQLFHQLHTQKIHNPSIKEFNECWAFSNAVRSYFTKKTKSKSKSKSNANNANSSAGPFDLVIDVAGGHGALAALFLILTPTPRAIVIDPAIVGNNGVHKAWKPFYENKQLVYRHECLRTALRDELQQAISSNIDPLRILVVACHACQHLSDETLEISCGYGVNAAVMPCCQKDLTNGSWKATGKSLNIGIAKIMDLLTAGKVMSWNCGRDVRIGDCKGDGVDSGGVGCGVEYDVRMKVIDEKITPQNRIILCKAMKREDVHHDGNDNDGDNDGENQSSSSGFKNKLNKAKKLAHERLERAYKKAHSHSHSNSHSHSQSHSGTNSSSSSSKTSTPAKKSKGRGRSNAVSKMQTFFWSSSNSSSSNSSNNKNKKEGDSNSKFCVKSAAVGVAAGFAIAALGRRRP